MQNTRIETDLATISRTPHATATSRLATTWTTTSLALRARSPARTAPTSRRSSTVAPAARARTSSRAAARYACPIAAAAAHAAAAPRPPMADPRRKSSANCVRTATRPSTRPAAHRRPTASPSRNPRRCRPRTCLRSSHRQLPQAARSRHRRLWHPSRLSMRRLLLTHSISGALWCPSCPMPPWYRCLFWFCGGAGKTDHRQLLLPHFPPSFMLFTLLLGSYHRSTTAGRGRPRTAAQAPE